MGHQLDVTTTNREVFKAEESSQMAQLVFKRFGRDLEAATQAWNRMMQTNVEPRMFKALMELQVDEPLNKRDRRALKRLQEGESKPGTLPPHRQVKLENHIGTLSEEIARINATPIGTIEPGPDGRNRYVPAKTES